MKKFFMIALGVLFAGNAMAIENEPKQGFTGMAFMGVNATHIKNTEYDGKAGGVFGFRLDYVLPKAHGAYATAGVDWTMKGGRYDIDVPTLGTEDVDATVKAGLHYFEVPIRVGFRYNISKEVGVYGELGPYFAVGLGGKHKLKVDADGSQWDKIEDDMTWKIFKKSSHRENFQRWDAGFGLSTTNTTTSCWAATGVSPICGVMTIAMPCMKLGLPLTRQRTSTSPWHSVIASNPYGFPNTSNRKGGSRLIPLASFP